MIAREIALEHPDRSREVLTDVLTRISRVHEALGQTERLRALAAELAWVKNA